MVLTVFAFFVGLILGGVIMWLNARGKDREIFLIKQSHETALVQQKNLLEARIQDHQLSEGKIKGSV